MKTKHWFGNYFAKATIVFVLGLSLYASQYSISYLIVILCSYLLGIITTTFKPDFI